MAEKKLQPLGKLLRSFDIRRVKDVESWAKEPIEGKSLLVEIWLEMKEFVHRNDRNDYAKGEKTEHMNRIRALVKDWQVFYSGEPSGFITIKPRKL